MKQPPPIFTGILGVFAISFVLLAMAPALQLNGLQPDVNEDTGDIYPIDVSGIGAQGRAVYISQGCVACHTEQVRGAGEGADLDARLGTAPHRGARLHLRFAGRARVHAIWPGPREYRDPDRPG